MEDTQEEIKTTKAIVEELLEKDIRCRNSDKWLTYKVFQKIAKENGERIFIPFNIFDKFPAFETVKRVRAKIQNEEKRYLPTEQDVIEKRSIKEREFKEFAQEEVESRLIKRPKIAIF